MPFPLALQLLLEVVEAALELGHFVPGRCGSRPAKPHVDLPGGARQVERDLRGHIAVRKLSFGTRDRRGSLQWAEGVTLNQTLRKQKRRLVDYVPEALAAVTRDQTLPSIFADPG